MLETDFTPNFTPLSLPPQVTDAEESVLGGILLDGDSIERVIEVLPDSQSFYIHTHQKIYGAMLRLRAASIPIDIQTISVWLTDHHQLEDVGGISKIASLVSSTVSSVNIDVYAKMVLEKYRRRQLIQAGNQIVELGHDTIQPTEIVVEKSEEKIFRIQQGLASDRYQLQSASEMALPLLEAFITGKNAGIATGWNDLDSLTGGLFRQTITIIGADSHMGKTSFMAGLAHTILRQGLPVLFFSCEMSKDQLNPRLIARVSGVDSSRLTRGNKPGGIKPEEWEIVQEAIAAYSELPFLIYDEPSPSLSTIRSVVKQSIRRFGQVGAVFLDYIQMLRIPGSQNRVQELGELTRQLRAIAKDYDFPMFVGSQVSRELSKRNDKRPTKNDLRDSGEIGEAADFVLGLYRDAHYSKNSNDKTIEIIVDKNRPFGRLGTARMLVDLETCHFMQVDNRYQSAVDIQEDPEYLSTRVALPDLDSF